MQKNEFVELIKSTNLIEIFDEGWLEENISDDLERSHPLSVLLKMDLEYTKAFLNDLDKIISTTFSLLQKDLKREVKMSRILGRLKSKENFNSCLPELDWITHLSDKSTDLVYEPTLPFEGHDIEANVGRHIAFEILSIEDSEADKNNEFKIQELMKFIRKIPSSYHVMISFKPEIHLEDIYTARKLIARKIHEFERDSIKTSSTFYYFSKNDIREWKDFDGISVPKDLYPNFEKYPLYIEGDKALLHFTLVFTGELKPYTYVGVGGPASFRNDDERIKEILKGKISQLPKIIPSIIIANVESPFADTFTILNSIFGDFTINLVVEKGSGKLVYETESRVSNGLFSLSTRISGVVFYKKTYPTGLSSVVYRNPNASIPISDEEAKILGEVKN
jgi:hypothetical protein